MGKSDKPMMRYSTSEMDVIELLDHLGWTAERELHISGVSMGGMIAQEIVCEPFTILCDIADHTKIGLRNTQPHCVSQSHFHRRGH